MRSLAATLVLLCSTSAAASTIAVLPLQASGPAAERLSGPARIELHRGLARLGHHALPVSEVDRLLLATDLACRRPDCLARSARLLRAQLLLGGRLEVAEGSATLALWLFDGERSVTLATRFERGHPAELGALCARALQGLLRSSGESPAGPLPASPAGSTRRQAGRGWLRWLKWSTGAAGLGGVTVGAGLWAAGRTGGPDPAGVEPARLLDLRPAGIALVTVGAALMVTSAVCFAIDGRSPSPREDR